MASPLVLLIRHGETDGNSGGRMQPPHEPLSMKAKQQALSLGRALQAREAKGEFRIAAVLSSDHTRTQETAAGIIKFLGRERRTISETPLLQERDFGDLRGMLYADIAK